jgi:hypothetical protein
VGYYSVGVYYFFYYLPPFFYYLPALGYLAKNDLLMVFNEVDLWIIFLSKLDDSLIMVIW